MSLASWKDWPRSRVSGGAISIAYRVEFADGLIFAKEFFDAREGMFAAEARGLELLGNELHGHVPKVLEVADTFVLLDWIEPGIVSDANLGKLLARLHQKTGDRFGLDHDNYIGLLEQTNDWSTSWDDFYLEHRIAPQLARARDAGLLSASDVAAVERASDALCREAPDELPRLLHGDLWSGNAHAAKDGNWYLIDPAVYYGHREIELAFMRWGGAFSAEAENAYQETIGMPEGFAERAGAWLMYPMLVHANTFGGIYVDHVRTCAQALS